MDSTPSYPLPASKTVVVIGAGVIGLTTALKIQITGRYQVEIVADILPTDPKNIAYTSQWAGAHYVSISPKGTALADIDQRTFHEFWELSKPGGEAEHCFLRIRQTEYYHSAAPPSDALEGMPNLQEVPAGDLGFGRVGCAYAFDTVTIDVPQYLHYLSARFLAAGGHITRGHVQHIDQLLEAGAAPFRAAADDMRQNEPLRSPDALVVCAGLGARTLGGVEDRSVHPARGQTVIVRAPWVRFGRTFEGESEWTYIIPRRSGNVVIGGTVGVNDWYPRPRPEETADLLRRGLELCPELLPPETSIGGPGKVEDLLPIIVEEACGLRPMRDDGPRIEVAPPATTKGRKIPVIYNYGHGARGYISSVGSAEVALDLMEKELNNSCVVNASIIV